MKVGFFCRWVKLNRMKKEEKLSEERGKKHLRREKCGNKIEGGGGDGGGVRKRGHRGR